MNDRKEPSEYDAVLSQNCPELAPTDAVLGGFSGVKQRYKSSNFEVRAYALDEALQYQEIGLELIIQALQDKNYQMRRLAYFKLKHHPSPRAKKIVEEANFYEFFQCVHTLKEHTHQVQSVAIAPNDRIFASCGNKDGSIHLYQLETGRRIGTLIGHTHYVRSLVFHPNGKILMSCSQDKTIKLWDIETQQEIRTLKGHRNWIQSITTNSDGSIIASGSRDKTIRLWETNTGREIDTLQGHTASVYSLSFAPNDRILASSGPEIKIWQLRESDREIRYIERNILNSSITTSLGGEAIAIHPSGKILGAATEENTIKLWNLDTGEIIHILKGHSESIRCLIFTPDGKMLISGSWDTTIKIWKVSTGGCLRTFPDHKYSVKCLAMSADGQTLVSGCGDKRIKIWQMWQYDRADPTL